MTYLALGGVFVILVVLLLELLNPSAIMRRHIHKANILAAVSAEQMWDPLIEELEKYEDVWFSQERQEELYRDFN